MANMMDFWRKVWKSVGDYSYIVDSEATRKKQHPVSYVFPVKDNFGEKKGECVYKSLEECCRSMGELKYDEKYWIELKGTDIINPEGVLFHEGWGAPLYKSAAWNVPENLFVKHDTPVCEDVMYNRVVIGSNTLLLSDAGFTKKIAECFEKVMHAAAE